VVKRRRFALRMRIFCCRVVAAVLGALAKAPRAD
jgi:hypothetical protein